MWSFMLQRTMARGVLPCRHGGGRAAAVFHRRGPAHIGLDARTVAHGAAGLAGFTRIPMMTKTLLIAATVLPLLSGAAFAANAGGRGGASESASAADNGAVGAMAYQDWQQRWADFARNPQSAMLDGIVTPQARAAAPGLSGADVAALQG
jgi:hypothetical protein